jgi:hypothetical protein
MRLKYFNTRQLQNRMLRIERRGSLAASAAKGLRNIADMHFVATGP